MVTTLEIVMASLIKFIIKPCFPSHKANIDEEGDGEGEGEGEGGSPLIFLKLKMEHSVHYVVCLSLEITLLIFVALMIRFTI